MKAPKRVAVAPDMAVVAEIMTCDRRVVDDILSPTESEWRKKVFYLRRQLFSRV